MEHSKQALDELYAKLSIDDEEEGGVIIASEEIVKKKEAFFFGRTFLDGKEY